MALQTEPPRTPTAAPEPRRLTHTRAWDLASKALLVAVFTVFAAAHFQHWRTTGTATGLGLVLQEALTAFLFLVRRAPRRTSAAPWDWLLAFGGSFLILLVRPSGHPLWGLDAVAIALQWAGLVGCLLALGVLGRSFGVVAADRGLRTGGPYAVVRHPVYASYLLTQTGYLLQNPSVWNLGLVLIVTACQVGRIHAEERVLAEDAAWAAFARHTRYRLLPGLF
ncbi:MAG TPA: methyltransferase [Dehalococcoidia bacterium]|nr:methyltransferase [Dehalococcoidia bacterium]